MVDVGVSIAIPEPFGTQLREARASFGDPLAATVPSHITLIPPTPLPDDEVDCFAGRLEVAAAETASFDVRLRGTGTFRPVSPVVYVAVDRGAVETEQLAARVRAALGDTIPDAQFPFHPHVTIAHGVEADALDRADKTFGDFECEFVVDSFALYLHIDPHGWLPRREFNFGR